MTREQFRALSRGDLIFQHGGGYGKVHACFIQGQFSDSPSYVDLKMDDGLFVTNIHEMHCPMIEKV